MAQLFCTELAKSYYDTLMNFDHHLCDCSSNRIQGLRQNKQDVNVSSKAKWNGSNNY